MSFNVIETAASVVAFEPRLVRQLGALAGLGRPDVASRITFEDVARRMGELYSACWRSEGVDVEDAIDEVANKRGLALYGAARSIKVGAIPLLVSAVAVAFTVSWTLYSSSFLSRFELVEARATAVALFLFVVLFFYSAYRFAETTPMQRMLDRVERRRRYRIAVGFTGAGMFLVAVIAMVHFLETDQVQGLIDLVVKYLAMTTQ